MGCTSFDLTIDGALADPVIGAAMRADRVDPRHLELLLRATARQLGEARPTMPRPLGTMADRVRSVVGGVPCRW